MARIGARLQSVLNERVFQASLERSALQNSRNFRGQLQDVDAVRSFFGSSVVLAVFDMPWTPLFLIAIFIFHPLLGWLALFGGTILILTTLANQVVTRKRNAQATSLGSEAARFAQQVENSAEMVWAQGMVRSVSDRWLALRDDILVQTERSGDLTGSMTSFTRAFRLFLQSATLALGAWLVLQGSLTAGAMIAVSILLGRALVPIETVLSQWPALQRTAVSWRDLNELLMSVPKRPVPVEIPTPVADLVVSKLSVQVSRGERPILHNVSLKLGPGEAVGVIGRSGSGKSTLARVIVGLTKPTAGEVGIGGAPIAQYGPERLGRHIGYLPQEVHLFDGTVAQNIAQMAMHPDQELVAHAAQKAGVHEVILRLPQGYDTVVGVGDTRLSGGQRQRLCLASALYDDPVLIVLDEPNSSLDAEGSEALNAAVKALKAEHKAVIIMTHRPTAISACDRLLVLDGGKVAASGPRDDVIRRMMKNAGDVQRLVHKVAQ